MTVKEALWPLAFALAMLVGCSAAADDSARRDDSGASGAKTEAADKPAGTAQVETHDRPVGTGDRGPPAPHPAEKGPASSDSATQAPPDKQTTPPDRSEKRQEAPPRPTHEHKAFKERVKERQDMVHEQIELEGVKNAEVLQALRTVPRHAFVRPQELGRAYADMPLPIGLGQTISQPFIVGYMTEHLALGKKDKVLEIGTGSGYQAAICAEIAAEVYSIEILKALGEPAAKRLEELGYRNVKAKVADGYWGWEEHGPYDAIIVTAAAPSVPPPLVKQLKGGGRLIIPVGGPFATQYLVLVTKDAEGKTTSKTLLPVRFVPLTRAKDEAKK